MDTTNAIRQMVLKNCTSGEIRDEARKGGMRTLNEDGWRLVRAGITTPEEVLRVTKDQSLSEREAQPAESESTPA
jgi:general secretion pathway protein E